ncbi:MAG: M23 family metallopeptidase [Patulibacter sp.]
MSARIAARVRIPVLVLGGVAFLVGLVAGVLWLALAGFATFFVGLVLYFRAGTVRTEPFPIRAPVTGRWSALSSPADDVPSHGLHAYGQSYAIDLVHVPEGQHAPELAWSPATRPPDEFPGFGRPVVATADGTVVKVHRRERDHRSRDSWPGLMLWFLESMFRELTGPGRLFGNHVVIEIAPGVYALAAHLQKGSVDVQKGDRVRAGQPIAACGNSGSSTEPHVHFQLMDRPGVLFAAGLPFTLTNARDDAGEPVAVPPAGTTITADG